MLPILNTTLVDSEPEILDELNLILSSDLFARSSVLSKFLKFIVEETLAGRTNGLKEYTIAVNGLGKSLDFNPQIDAIIRIHAGRLRRSLNEYYVGSGKNDRIKIEVIKGTYIPVFRSNVINKPDEVLQKKSKPIEFSRSKLTLAVLPFRNLCPDKEYQFFVEGFGEELTRIFSSESNIAVVAHHSARKYASIEEDIRIIGADLGAHYLINGSVKRSNTEIRVSVGLVETLNGMLIWSKDYSHVLEKEKIFDIQDQINNEVFSILSGHYGFIIRDSIADKHDKMDQNLNSFDAVFWNYHAQMSHSIEACKTSRKALEDALANDINNVMCMVMLADLYLNLHLLGYPNIDDPVNEAYRLIKKAIKFAPRSQRAHLAFGWVNICLGEKEKAIQSLKYSLKLGPLSASTRGDIGFSLICAGEYKQSYSLLLQALELNPYCPWWYFMGFFFIHFNNENYEEALQSANNMNASEDVFLNPLLTAAAKGQMGLVLEAQTEVNLLQQKFQPILENLRMHLEFIVLDHNLVDKILTGVRKAGLEIVSK
ncbi:adenylate cyclase [Formosa agariphila KMM 3901]|uniref:Adenylate cyclase n=1 Tax=Formosa agariphila (strain DSM 15362 / KCTC 12365 / LMG 23005 / KMM 3901 / M-2Alg 35-1) TaxID=1347342 RepID=T2KJC4_FORAG|nr:hypothetical protein [Formosa agariphila]CDF78870.1 adenylate cyclase [Formosa agariphila KMM 3901]